MAERREGVCRRGFLHDAGATVLVGSVARRIGLAGPELKSERKVRIGVVGGGFGAHFQWHLHLNCIVEAMSDLIPGRRRRLQNIYRCAKAYESLEKLVLEPKVEAVAVFTGAPDHARYVLECMDKGKHVISAVPACLTLEEAAALKGMKEKTGRST